MSTTQYKQPYIQKHVTQNKYFVPKNEEDEPLKNNLFLDFTEGNYLKIKDNILKNNMITNIRDENDNNILHHIIKNENLTESQKIELINIVLPNIDVSLSDRYNITPLHLACQFQHKKIIELLLENGAEVNKTDSFGKSAIHYAVTGKDTLCPTPKSNKIQPITKTKADKTDKVLKELKSLVNEIFIGDYDGFVSVNLRHLRTYLEDYKNIFPEEDKKNNENIQKIISDILSNPEISINDKTQVLFQKILSERDNIYKNFEEIINHENLINLTIQSNPENNWTPTNDTNKINKIMKKYYDDMIISDIQKENDDINLKNENTINTLLNDFNNKIGNLRNCHSEFTSSIIMIFYYIENLCDNNIFNIGDNIEEIKFINLINNKIVNIKFPEINYPNIDNVFTGIFQDPIDATYNFDPDETLNEPETFYTFGEILNMMKMINDLQLLFGPAPALGGPLLQNNGVPIHIQKKDIFITFISQNNYNHLMRMIKNKLNLNFDHNNPNPINNAFFLDITNFFQNFINEKNNESKSGDKFENKNFIKININDKISNILNLYFDANIAPYPLINFFTGRIPLISSKLKFYLWRIEKNIANINTIKDDIIGNINNNRYDLFFNKNLSDFIVEIINGGILYKYLSNIYDEYLNFQIMLEKISKDMIKKTKENLKNNNPNANDYNNKLKLISFIFEGINSHIKNIKEQIENLREISNVNNIYNNFLKKMYDWTFNIKNYIEKNSAIKIFTQYHKTNNNDYFINMIDSFISYKFINMNESLPSTYEKFIKDFSESEIVISKKIYIENYIPKININYPIAYYFIGIPVVPGLIPQQFKEGYLLDDQQSENIRKSISINIGDNIIFKKNIIDATTGNLVLEVGKIKIKQSPQRIIKYDMINFDKNTGFPIIFSLLGKYHIGMIKYKILEDKINEIYDIINRTIPFPNNTKENIKKENIRNKTAEFEGAIKNFKKNSNDHNPILVIIGNYMKNLINKYISDLAFRSANKAILSYINQRYFPQFYKQIEENITKNSEILAKKTEGYVLNLNNIYENFFKNKIKKSRFEDMGKITQGVLVDELENKDKDKIHRILNTNYHEIKSSREICYIIDEDIIDILAKYRADVNIKDRNGQSPLFTAINTKNIKVIDKLIQNNASVLQQDKNGETPFKHAIDFYIKSIDNDYVNIYDVCDSVTKNIFEDFSERHKGNLPKNASIIFGVSLHMLNHHFLTLAEDYYGKWNHQVFEKLKNIFISLGSDFNNLLPLLDVNLEPDDFGHLDIFNQKLNQDTKKIKKIQQEISKLDSNISSLNGEKVYINKKSLPLSQYDANRLNYINDKLKDLYPEIAKLRRDLNNLIATENNSFTEKNNKFTKPKINLQTHKANLKYNNNIVELYDSAFIDVINYNKRNRLNNNKYEIDIDYMTYPNLWKKYISNIKENIKNNQNLDHTSFIEIMNIYQKDILSNNQLNINDKINNLQPIFAFYSRIAYPYIKNYLELPKEYNTVNQCLDTIINIIVHVLKRCILVTFYYEICANIQSYLEETFKDAENSNIIKEYFKSIIGDKYNSSSGSKLADYIFGNMSLKITKKILNIYEGDNDGDDDPDKNELSFDSLFENIIQILNTNTTVSLISSGIETDVLLKNIKDVVFPRQKEYIRLAVENLYSLMNNYLYYLYGQSQDINIIKKLK
jgi:hypothetical protein